ncbi:MAG: hypothetical protein AB1744_15050, partial [Candidatus Zixiibacteriota bacterium]
MKALFITIEDGDDLIVSFAIPVSDPSDVRSLTLLRTPKYEFILDDAERGVTISDDDFPDEEDSYLQEVEVGKDVVRLVTSQRYYTIDVKDVDDDEKKRMKKIFKRMNFDDRFTLK